jgi:hypothetical protein
MLEHKSVVRPNNLFAKLIYNPTCCRDHRYTQQDKVSYDKYKAKNQAIEFVVAIPIFILFVPGIFMSVGERDAKPRDQVRTVSREEVIGARSISG